MRKLPSLCDTVGRFSVFRFTSKAKNAKLDQRTVKQIAAEYGILERVPLYALQAGRLQGLHLHSTPFAKMADTTMEDNEKEQLDNKMVNEEYKIWKKNSVFFVCDEPKP